MSTPEEGEWLRRLRQPGPAQTEAIAALRDYLLRSVLVYLQEHRSDLAEWSAADIRYFAEDVAQEALLSINKNLDSFRGDSKFTTWAYRFAINTAASELRLSRYLDLSLEKLQEQESAAFDELLRGEQEMDPDLAAERQLYLDLLREIIQNDLTERQRFAVLSVHFQGRSMDEVAAQLGTSRNSAYKMLHDARRKIRAKLQDHHLSAGDILALFESQG